MCEFPAFSLLKLRREAARRADASSDIGYITALAGFCLKVDQLRMAHEDIASCGCWYEAVKEYEEAERIGDALVKA